MPSKKGGNKIIICGDCLTELKKLDSKTIDCCVTSPPYWALRDYGVAGQLGLEPTFQEYITKLCDIFDEVKRVLKDEGTCWVNIGDTYGTKSGSGFANDNLNPLTPEQIAKTTGIYKANELRGPSKEMHKNLCNIPARFSIEMQNRGWILRNEIIWFKPNCMPSSVKDRFTVDYEKVFFFVKQKKYFFKTQYEPQTTKPHAPKNSKALVLGSLNGSRYGEKDFDRIWGNEQGRNKRCVWQVTTKPFKEAHFATYPEKLIEPMIDAGCPIGGVVLDPFAGAGTTGVVAKKQNKKFVGIELNPEYIKMAEKRIENTMENLL